MIHVLSNTGITKTLIRLRVGIGWSVPFLFAKPEDRGPAGYCNRLSGSCSTFGSTVDIFVNDVGLGHGASQTHLLCFKI